MPDDVDRTESPERPPPEEETSAANPFAVPEGRARAVHRVASRVVVPENEEQDEDALLAGGNVAPQTGESELGPVARYEGRFVVLLFLLAVLAVLVTSRDVGIAWDEPYYVTGGERLLAWFEAFGRDGPAPIRGEALNRYWDAAELEPRGHPAMTRYLAALGILLRLPGDSAVWIAMRRPFALVFALTLVILYLLVRRSHGRVTAWIAVVSYLLMPRVFGHAHFALTETPMSFFSVLTVYAFLRGLDSPRWAAATGVFFGLALATKINALALLAILPPWAFLFHRPRSTNNLYAMVFLGPAVMGLAWPWMWDEPLVHFAKYLFWNADHAQTPTLYLGDLYTPETGAAPWHYPLVMLVLTTPPLTLVLAATGVARTCRAPRGHYVGLLYVWAAAVPCLLQSVPSVPKYDGIRLFLPALPFVAVLAGIGGTVFVRMAAFFGQRRGHSVMLTQAALGAMILLVFVTSGYALRSVRGQYLAYFSFFVGGPRGALERGLEITYWGEAIDREALDTINTKVPDGATLMPRAVHNAALELYHDAGWLKPSIRLVEDQGPADYHLVQYRPGFLGWEDRLLISEFSDRRVAAFPLGGPPRAGLYRTGEAFAERLRAERRARNRDLPLP